MALNRVASDRGEWLVILEDHEDGVEAMEAGMILNQTVSSACQQWLFTSFVWRCLCHGKFVPLSVVNLHI